MKKFLLLGLLGLVVLGSNPQPAKAELYISVGARERYYRRHHWHRHHGHWYRYRDDCPYCYRHGYWR